MKIRKLLQTTVGPHHINSYQTDIAGTTYYVYINDHLMADFSPFSSLHASHLSCKGVFMENIKLRNAQPLKQGKGAFDLLNQNFFFLS